MFIASVLTATDTAFDALDWTREALAGLGCWQDANSRRLIAFLDSDHFHRAIRHTARVWVILCIMVRFIISMLSPTAENITIASEAVMTEMDMQRLVTLSTFTADCWPDDADDDLARINGWEA